MMPRPLIADRGEVRLRVLEFCYGRETGGIEQLT